MPESSSGRPKGGESGERNGARSEKGLRFVVRRGAAVEGVANAVVFLDEPEVFWLRIVDRARSRAGPALALRYAVAFGVATTLASPFALLAYGLGAPPALALVALGPAMVVGFLVAGAVATVSSVIQMTPAHLSVDGRGYAWSGFRGFYEWRAAGAYDPARVHLAFLHDGAMVKVAVAPETPSPAALIALLDEKAARIGGNSES